VNIAPLLKAAIDSIFSTKIVPDVVIVTLFSKDQDALLRKGGATMSFVQLGYYHCPLPLELPLV
jgi:hypothetical protein